MFFRFRILYTVSRTPWTGDQPVTRLLPIHRTISTQNKHTDMARIGFKPTTTMIKRAKIVYT
jgi:hypothetical protein